MLKYTCLHSVHPAGLSVPDRALTGHKERLLRTHHGAVAGCRGGVLVSDGEEPAFPSGWRCGADADAGWGLCWEGTQSCAQSFAKAVSVRTVENLFWQKVSSKVRSLLKFYQECFRGRELCLSCSVPASIFSPCCSGGS